MSSTSLPRFAALAALLSIALLAGVSCSQTRKTKPAAAAALAPATDRIVVMISVDGLAGFYLDDPKAEMPTIRALMAEGAGARMTASNPTVTWPNHTTLVTGVTPARHGVVGNNYLDRATLKPVTLIGDPVFDKDQIVKVPTIYDVAKSAGMKTAGILWPASRNAKSLDWTTPDVHTVELYEKYATPSLQAEIAAAGIPAPMATVAGVEPEASRDKADVPIFNLIVRTHRPQLALLHLINVDHTQHLKGPRTPAAYAAVAEADAYVRQVWDELKRDFPGEKATLLVVSDHGFSAIEHAILPNVILRKAGLLEVKTTRVTGGAVRLVPQGGSGMLYFTGNPTAAEREDLIARVTKAFDGVKGMRKVVPTAKLGDYGLPDPKVDPHGPDMLLLAEEGWIFGDTAAGELPFNEKPERAGSHGHDASIPDLQATFVAWGAGIRPAGRLPDIRNTDVAPTLARLLGVDLPNVDGKPVAAALADGKAKR